MVDGGGLPFALGGLLITSSEDGGVHIRVAQHAVASDSLSHSEFTLPPPAAGWRFEAAATVLHHGTRAHSHAAQLPRSQIDGCACSPRV